MENTYIDQFITKGQTDTIGLHNFYDTILVTNNHNHYYRIPFNDFFLKYYKELESTAQMYSLPQTMFYKPKSVAYDVYGTTEMWLPILRLNKMRSVVEFNKPIILLYNPERVNELISIFFKREGKY